MINIRFFGLVRSQIGAGSIEISADTVGEALKLISSKYEGIDLNTLKNSLIFINSVDIRDLKMFKTLLKEGDEVMILPPAAGG